MPFEIRDARYGVALKFLQSRRPQEADEIVENILNGMEMAIVNRDRTTLANYLDDNPDIEEILTTPILVDGKEENFLTIVRNAAEAMYKAREGG